MSLNIRITKEIIRSALNICKNPLICFSGGKDSTLMLYYVWETCKELKREVPLVLVGDPFPIPENLEFCKYVLTKFGITNFIFMERFVDDEGLKVYVEERKDVELCCRVNKINLLNKIIERFNIDCVFVAIRWDEHPARSTETYFKLIEKPRHIRVHPILHWSWLDVLRFYLEHKDLLNPLYLKGYTSLGCKPCTKPTINKQFNSVEEYIQYILEHEVKERAGRIQDKEQIMEKLRAIGYF